MPAPNACRQGDHLLRWPRWLVPLSLGRRRTLRTRPARLYTLLRDRPLPMVPDLVGCDAQHSFQQHGAGQR